MQGIVVIYWRPLPRTGFALRDVGCCMEVKDVSGRHPDESTKIVKAQSGIASIKVDVQAVTVSLHAQPKQTMLTEMRSKLNDAISITNVAVESTKQIDKFLKSIDGIVELVSDEKVPPQRRDLLEAEANELVSQIKKEAHTAAPDGSKPLSGDKIRLELEEKIGKALEVILPDDAKEAFNLGEIKFSAKDSILNVRAAILEAKAKLEYLKESVGKTSKAVQDAATVFDVAVQNAEASTSSVRDVDAAISLASGLGSGISDSPTKALVSHREPSSLLLD